MPSSAAKRRQQQRLAEQLAEQAPRAGTQRVAYRHLALPLLGAQQQQVGDVDAGEQQQQADRGEQRQQRRPAAAEQRALERPQRRPFALREVAGVNRRELAHDAVEVGFRARQRHPGPQPRHGVEAVRFDGLGVERAAVERHRHPHVGVAGVVEAGRHDADDRARPPVEHHLAAEHAAVAAEGVLPQPVREHHHVVAPRRVFGGEEAAPERRRDAEGREERLHHPRRHQLPRLSAAEQRRLPPGVGSEAAEGPRPRAVLHRLVRRQRAAADASGKVRVRPDGDQLVGAGVRQRPQQHRLDDGEGRRGGADPEPQRADGEQQEGRAAGEAAQGGGERQQQVHGASFKRSRQRSRGRVAVACASTGVATARRKPLPCGVPVVTAVGGGGARRLA